MDHLRKGDAVHHRHDNIADDDMRLQFLHQAQCLISIGRFAYDLVALLLPMNHVLESLPHNIFIINDQNTNHLSSPSFPFTHIIVISPFFELSKSQQTCAFWAIALHAYVCLSIK